jgi:hypothetical protein
MTDAILFALVTAFLALVITISGALLVAFVFDVLVGSPVFGRIQQRRKWDGVESWPPVPKRWPPPPPPPDENPGRS